MIYQLNTSNSFFFRGNGSFNAGSVNFSEGIFPPNPQTIYGALRSNYIRQYGSIEAFKNGEMKDKIGTIDSHGDLSINAILLAWNDILFVPLPQDSQVTEEDEVILAQLLTLKQSNAYQNDNNTYRFIAAENRKSKSSDNKWLAIHDWKAFISGEKVKVYDTSSFIVSEPKIGIARSNRTNTTQEGMLYQHEKYYLKEGVSIIVDMQIPNELTNLTFGNKGSWWVMKKNTAYDEKWRAFIKESQDKAYLLSQDAIRMTLLTPSLVKSSVIDGDMNLRFGQYPLYQAVINRPIMTGGWDMMKRRPKPRIPMLKAGTSFAVQVPDKGRDEWLENLKNGSYTDDQAVAGYGRILLSPMKKER